MPKIDGHEFGSLVVDGVEQTRDVIPRATPENRAVSSSARRQPALDFPQEHEHDDQRRQGEGEKVDDKRHNGHDACRYARSLF